MSEQQLDPNVPPSDAASLDVEPTAPDTQTVAASAKPCAPACCRCVPKAESTDDAARWPIWGAAVAIFVGLLLVIWRNNNPSFDLVVLVAANSVAQMFLDFFKGRSKPIFSALARALPIAIGLANYYWPLISNP